MKKEAIRELSERVHFGEPFDAKKFDRGSDPSVSIYMPIQHAEREERRDEWNRIEFKDLTKQAKKQLAERFPDARTYAGVMELLDYILDHADLPLWTKADKGLGFLVDNEQADVFNMDVPTDCLSIVDDHFYVGPLMQDEEHDAVKYKLLLLNADFFSILDGDEEHVRYEHLPHEVKQYFTEMFPDTFDGDTSPLDYYSLEGHESPYHDHRSRNDVKKEEAEKFFRVVDKVMCKMTEGDDTPVILVTLPEREHMFREIATFKTLLPKGIDKDPRTLSGARLVQLANEVLAE